MARRRTGLQKARADFFRSSGRHLSGCECFRLRGGLWPQQRVGLHGQPQHGGVDGSGWLALCVGIRYSLDCHDALGWDAVVKDTWLGLPLTHS